MVKRIRNHKSGSDQIIEPDSVEYDKQIKKFDSFPTKKRYHAGRPRQKKETPRKPTKPTRPSKPSKTSESIEVRPKKGAEEFEERFDKAFILSLGLIALFSLLIFIPILGPFIVLTLVPFMACNLGCRYVSKHNGIQVGFIVGTVWSIIQIYLLFQFLKFFKISIAEPGIYTPLDTIIIILLFLANIIFCMFGGYLGGAKFEALKKSIEDSKGIERENIHPN